MKHILDGIRNVGIIWFCLMVCWYLDELVEAGAQYAAPQGPTLAIALATGVLFTLFRWSTEEDK
jgi:hypothetical protein